MRPILVTTDRGVFFGYVKSIPKTLPGEVKLTNARNCIYWSADMKGFVGLATIGPSSSCRIGQRAKSLTIYNVTCVVEVEESAAEKWEAAPWNS